MFQDDEHTTRTARQAGPVMRDYTQLPGRDGEQLSFCGRMLGYATSNRSNHDHHVSYDAGGELISFSPPGERCSACRWFEVRIFEIEHEYDDAGEPVDRRGRYLVLTSGMSIVPGEVEMRRASWTDSPYEVVEILTQRRDQRPFLPAPSARVLSQAANWDSGIRAAYIDRAVV